MNKVSQYAASYAMWIVNMAIGAWIIFIARTDLTSFLALFYKEGNLTYGHAVDFADKAFSIALGLGWLALMIVAEQYYRHGVEAGDLWRRIGRLSGPLFLAAFAVDLIYLALQGFHSGWLRWLILVVEFGIGIALTVEGNPKLAPKPG